MGTPGGLQHLVLIVGDTVAFAAEEVVLEGVLVCGVRSRSRFELGEFMGGIGSRVEQSAEE